MRLGNELVELSRLVMGRGSPMLLLGKKQWFRKTNVDAPCKRYRVSLTAHDCVLSSSEYDAPAAPDDDMAAAKQRRSFTAYARAARVQCPPDKQPLHHRQRPW